MEAGRELDALVAEMVLGYKLMRWINHPSYEPVIINDGSGSCLPIGLPIPRYSTDIAAAWQVVERMRLSISPMTENEKIISWVVSDKPDLNDALVIVADVSAPLAVCRAALKIVEH